MKKVQETNTRPVVSSRRDNEYVLTRRDMSAPYFTAYCAARSQGPVSRKAPVMRSVTDAAPSAQYYEDDYYEAPPQKAPRERKASKRSTRGYAKPARRLFFVLLIVLFLIVYIAVAALNYLNMDALSDYYEYLFSIRRRVIPWFISEWKIS